MIDVIVVVVVVVVVVAFVELVETVEMVEMVEMVFVKKWTSLRSALFALFFLLTVSPSQSLIVPKSYSLNVPKSQSLQPTGYGPEDLVIDSLNNPPRILISTCARRDEYPAWGEIQTFDPETGKVETLPRVNEPEGLVFRPHGISLLNSDGNRYLFVISHDDVSGKHPVLVYRVEPDRLVCERVLEDPLLVSPNALQAYPDGSILVCNDAARRGSMKEKIFRQKKGNIIRFDGKQWVIVAKRLGMPAGLAGSGEDVYVCTSLENKLYKFTYAHGKLTEKQLVCKVKGGDNIRIYPGFLLTTSHFKPLKFIGHVGNKSKPSPSRIIKVDLPSGTPKILFEDDGRLFSAASVTLLWKNKLITGQIFESNLLINELD
jgi:hypothetical protein